MKKLIFRKINKDTSYLFIILCLSLGLIVWTLQAVNYLDFVTQDGHGLKTYFLYSVFNFPKILHRLIPFVFFISLFLILINYESRNELLIFWTHGITKIRFANKILYLSLVLFLIQVFLGSFVSPLSQLKSRMLLKESDLNLFSSLVKEGKFINAVSGLTIFIDKKNNDGTFENIFIDDSSKENTKMTYANRGEILELNEIKIFKLFNGKVIDKKKNKINVFEFDQIDFNLSVYATNTILTPKLQETSSKNLFNCFLSNFIKNNKIDSRNCNVVLIDEINQELLKRFYKPIYIPLIGIICSFLIILPKNSSSYKSQVRLTFIFGFILLIFSETSLRYSTTSITTSIIYLLTPWVIFLTSYLLFIRRAKNV